MPLIMIKSDPRAREKPCLRCGYSLRKLLDAKHCPECGLSVWLSLNPNDTLDWSNPEWLKKLSVAAAALAAAQAVGIAACIAFLIPWFQIESRIQWEAFLPLYLPAAFGVRYHVISLLLGGGYLVAYHLALIALAADEGRHPDRWRTYRWSCRITGGIGCLIGVMVVLNSVGAMPNLLLPILVKAALIASCLSTWAYLRRLAQRIPQSTLARLSGYLMFLPVLPLLTLLKFVPFFAMFAMFEFYRFLDYLPILYLPFSLGLLVWCARLFRRSVGSAQKSWASETAE